jgi:hypothetical protein
MDLYKYSDHVRAAVARMLAAEQPKPRLRNMFSNEAHRVQLLEDATWDWWNQLDLEAADGVFLDRIGEIVGESRQGRPDDVYRLWIRARAKANRSSGSVGDLLEILELILPANTPVTYTEMPYNLRDAEAQFMIYGEVDYPDQVRAILYSVTPAGVQLDIGYVTFPIEEAFTYDTGPAYDVGLYAGVL